MWTEDSPLKYMCCGTVIPTRVLERLSGSDPLVNNAVQFVHQLVSVHEVLKRREQQQQERRKRQQEERQQREQQRRELSLEQRQQQRRQQRQEEDEEDEEEQAEEAIATAVRTPKKPGLNEIHQHELIECVSALLLVIVEEHRGTILGGMNDIKQLAHDIQYFVRLYESLLELGSSDQVELLKDNALEIESCWARVNGAMDMYAVDSRIKNAVGLAELGTGTRIMRELVVTGLQEHQLVSPFVHPTRRSGLSDDIASQVTWLNYNPPWNSSGAFADVFIGWHTVVGKVALKRLRMGEDLDDVTKKRFEIERDMWQRLRHHNILQLLGTFMHDDLWFFVSPFMKNGSLPFYLERDPLVDRLRVLREIANGLKYLHVKGIVHGDIKAHNILVTDDFHAQLCDFGLAKFFGAYTATVVKGIGSMRWQGPELLDEEPRTAESDVYAFGMTVVEVLTGDVPFPALKSVPGFIKAVHVHSVRPPKVPEYSPEGVSYAQAWNVAELC